MTAATTQRRAPGMRVREMSSTDIEGLVELDAALFADDAWPATTWWAELAQRPRREYVVLADEEDGIVAYGGIDHGGETADVMTVAVSPVAQGRGLGRLILGELETRAAVGGASGVLLEVRADNTAALALYDRAGWRQVHVRRRYYQPGDVDALILAKDVATEGNSP